MIESNLTFQHSWLFKTTLFLDSGSSQYIISVYGVYQPAESKGGGYLEAKQSAIQTH